MNAHQEAYGEERFLDLLRGSQAMSAKDLNLHITQDVTLFVGGAEQSDDITLMTLKRL
jgi:serine phosphatase RsbU (regulator of sigma subunit)